MTLGRDLERLATHGLRLVAVQPVDMMPHTAHVEVVCTLTRA
jgi:tRNA/tmRNA/rRNA uracil-C5-methylase (TrmA/RlmC/RlmD family)